MTTRSDFCPEFNVHNRLYSSYCNTRLGSAGGGGGGGESNAGNDLNIQLGPSKQQAQMQRSMYPHNLTTGGIKRRQGTF